MNKFFIILVLFNSYMIFAQDQINFFEEAGFWIGNNGEKFMTNEPSVKINPSNDNNFVCAYNLRELTGGTNPVYKNASIGISITNNNGVNWYKTVLPKMGKDLLADPILDFTSSGILWCSYLGANTDMVVNGQNDGKTGIYANFSLDGGGSWQQNSLIIKESEDENVDLDKPYLHINKLTNDILVAFSETVPGNNGQPPTRQKIKFSFFNSEIQKFSLPITINEIDNNVSSVNSPIIITDSQNNIYVFINILYLTSRQIRLIKLSLNDNNLQIISEQTIAEVNRIGHDVEFSTGTFGYLGQSPWHFRVNSFPSIAIDNFDNLYVVWSDKNVNGDGDIVLIKSNNLGSNWSSKTPINNSTQVGEQFFPWVTVDEENRISLIFYHMDSNQSTIINTVYSVSNDGGNTFINTYFSHGFNYTTSYFPNNQNFIGDYLSISSYNDHIITASVHSSEYRHGILIAKIPRELTMSAIVDLGGQIPIEQLRLKIDNVSQNINLTGSEFKITPFKYFQCEIEDEIYHSNEFRLKFRNWNNLATPDYRKMINKMFNYSSHDVKITTQYFPVISLSVTNSLEGYNLNNNYKIKWNATGEEQTMNPNDPPYYAFDFSITEDEYNITAFSSFQLAGTSWYFQNWATGETTTLLPNEQITVTNNSFTAIYKGSQRSDNADAFDNSSQRKFIKTGDGVMHHVYESMGKVWYEKSTNNGGDWILMNDGKALSGNSLSKNPSVSSLLNNKIVVLFQLEDANHCWVIAKVFIPGQSTPASTSEIKEIYLDYSTNDVHPVGILTGYYDYFVAVWNQNYMGIFGETPGLYYNYSIFNNNTNNFDGWHFTSQGEGIVSGTDEWSFSPSIACYLTGNPGTLFHLLWEQKSEVEFSTIMHVTGIGANYGNGDEVFFNEDLQSISSLSGFPLNSTPSLVVWNDNIARICWVGKRQEANETWTKQTIFAASDNPSHYWNFGNNVTSSNINRTSNASGSGIGYIIGWSENNTTNKIVDNHLSSGYIRTVSSIGKDIQISHGNTFANMFATSFNTANSTHMYFNQSSNIQSYYDNPSKISTTSISEGREGIVAKNKLQFYFGVGDVKVDNELVSFKEIADSVRFSNLQTLNQYLTTEPFPLTDNSSFYYSVQFGVTDTSYAQNSLSANSFVKFRVLLLDDNTNQLIGVYDEITYTLANLLQHKNIAYQVNTNGIGNRTVRLALEVTENIEPKYALAEKYADDYVITKEKYETISFQGKLGVTEYALEQNYPNPFNPVTTIRYQIPKAGRVSLKVYDILGKEITTLVNEEKETGRYTVNFDASALSSGMYLYEIVVNDYRAVKKLMTIK